MARPISQEMRRFSIGNRHRGAENNQYSKVSRYQNAWSVLACAVERGLVGFCVPRCPGGVHGCAQSIWAVGA